MFLHYFSMISSDSDFENKKVKRPHSTTKNQDSDDDFRCKKKIVKTSLENRY